MKLRHEFHKRTRCVINTANFLRHKVVKTFINFLTTRLTFLHSHLGFGQESAGFLLSGDLYFPNKIQGIVCCFQRQFLLYVKTNVVENLSFVWNILLKCFGLKLIFEINNQKTKQKQKINIRKTLFLTYKTYINGKIN